MQAISSKKSTMTLLQFGKNEGFLCRVPLPYKFSTDFSFVMGAFLKPVQLKVGLTSFTTKLNDIRNRLLSSQA